MVRLTDHARAGQAARASTPSFPNLGTQSRSKVRRTQSAYFAGAAKPVEVIRELALDRATQCGRERGFEEPSEQRPAEVAVAHFVAQDPIERALCGKDGARGTKLFEERHGDGFAETEDVGRDARDVVLERTAPAAEREPFARELRHFGSFRGNVDAVAHLGVRELVGDDAKARADQIGRGADLDEPECELLRDRRGTVLGFDAAEPLAAHGVRRGGGLHGATSRGASLLRAPSSRLASDFAG